MLYRDRRQHTGEVQAELIDSEDVSGCSCTSEEESDGEGTYVGSHVSLDKVDQRLLEEQEEQKQEEFKVQENTSQSEDEKK